MKEIGIYVHIPFCRRRCPYCDFVVQIDPLAKIDQYLALCLSELKLVIKKTGSCSIKTIYFGGGTPSLASVTSIATFISEIRLICDTSALEEITLECNPEDKKQDFLELRKAGVTRLSIGCQSMQDTKLKKLGRMHTKIDIENCVANARAAGLDNISLDIIFATPDETIESLARDIKEFLALKPQHISSYELTIEKGTQFFELVREQKISKPDDDQVSEQMILINETLSKNGFEHYEISNFSLPGFASMHNSNYWAQKEYIGLGIGSHSFINNQRSANVSSIQSYHELLQQTKLPISYSENLGLEQIKNELIMFGLRTKKGICLHTFLKITGEHFLEVYRNVVLEAEKANLILVTADAVEPTQRGMMVADALTRRFIEL